VAPAAAGSSLISPVAWAGSNWPVVITASVTDSSGNIYLTGNRAVVFPSSPQQDERFSVFASKIDATGATVYAVSIGGKGNDYALGIATDSSGNAYIVGKTSSPDFPLSHPLQSQPTVTALSLDSASTGFVLKLGPAGDLLWSTYFGGVAPAFSGSAVNAVAVDAQVTLMLQE
jgi:hypothetical protein